MQLKLYRKIFKALNEDLNMILSDDDFEEPEIDLGIHMANIQKKLLSDSILKKCEEQDEQGLKELINNCWDGKNSIFFASNDNIKDVVEFSVQALGNQANLNWIDTSNVTDMSGLFRRNYPWQDSYSFNGDISKWDVSSVENMSAMFYNSKFNGDISGWNVLSVTNMDSMFYESKFNGDISQWDVSSVTNMSLMFAGSKFNQDISSWTISKSTYIPNIFTNCPIKEEYKPKFND